MEAQPSPSLPPVYSLKKAMTFVYAQIADVTSYQTFTFLIFTFYFTVVKLDVRLVSVGFVIWSIWNSLNDPLLGHFSDRTHTKYGRRKPWMLIALVPLAAIMILLFTPPMQATSGWKMGYFLFIICLFEFFYTMFSLNQVSLFPEIFIVAEDRFKANNIKQIASIGGLIFAFILPTFIIPDMTSDLYQTQYIIVGAICAVIILFFGFLFFKNAPEERIEFQNDYKNTPGFLQSLKFSLKNKAFTRYIPTEIASWFVFGMLPTIVPLYGKYVLGIDENSIMLGVLLGVSFLSAAAFMPFWKKVVGKLGVRKSWMLSQACWIVSLLPFLFITSRYLALAAFVGVGFGMAGTLYFIDLIVSDIIDSDEVEHGSRREAGYYGINAFFCRFSTILVFLAISLIFDSVGWQVYDPEVVTADTIFGLRALMCIFPSIALIIGIVAMYFYPLDGEALKSMKVKLQAIHEQKKSNVDQ